MCILDCYPCNADNRVYLRRTLLSVVGNCRMPGQPGLVSFAADWHRSSLGDSTRLESGAGLPKGADDDKGGGVAVESVVGRVGLASSRAVFERAAVGEARRWVAILGAHRELEGDGSQVEEVAGSKASHWGAAVPMDAAEADSDCVEGQQATSLGQRRCLVDCTRGPGGMGRNSPSRAGEEGRVSEGAVEVDGGPVADMAAEGDHPAAVVCDRGHRRTV